MNKTENKITKPETSKQMFNVTCNVTGASKRVRRPVHMQRVAKLQRLTRSLMGLPVSVESALAILSKRYVSLEGRKQAGVDFLGVPVTESLFALITKPAKAKKAKVVKTALAVNEKPGSYPMSADLQASTAELIAMTDKTPAVTQ